MKLAKFRGPGLWAGAVVVTAVTLPGPAPAEAAPVFWTDWTSGTAGPAGSATGSLNVNGTDVTVNYSGEIAFIQTGTGTNYWTSPTPDTTYLSPTVDNKPPDSDIIALSLATSKTITFSEAIANPLFAVVSLNGNGYRFDRDFDILSFGPGFWGDGTLTKTNPEPGVFQLNGTGEPHGVIQFQGAFDTVTWTSLTNEFWNGFTIGVTGLASDLPDPTPIPTPSAAAAGLIMLGLMAVRRRRRR